jgi:hypothetical protein
LKSSSCNCPAKIPFDMCSNSSCFTENYRNSTMISILLNVKAHNFSTAIESYVVCLSLDNSVLNFCAGYVTSTNIKILAMLSESIGLNHEIHLKTLFSKVHNLFVEYVLNPWSVLQSRIDSVRFNKGVDTAIVEYSESIKESSE